MPCPSVKNKNIFSPLLQGAPNSSLCAVPKRSSPFLKASKKFVPPFAPRLKIALIANALLVYVALKSLSEKIVLAKLSKLTTPKKSLLPKVFTTALADSLARMILLPLIDPETSINKITFFAPEVA